MVAHGRGHRLDFRLTARHGRLYRRPTGPVPAFDAVSTPVRPGPFTLTCGREAHQRMEAAR